MCVASSGRESASEITAIPVCVLMRSFQYQENTNKQTKHLFKVQRQNTHTNKQEISKQTFGFGFQIKIMLCLTFHMFARTNTKNTQRLSAALRVGNQHLAEDAIHVYYDIIKGRLTELRV